MKGYKSEKKGLKVVKAHYYVKGKQHGEVGLELSDSTIAFFVVGATNLKELGKIPEFYITIHYKESQDTIFKYLNNNELKSVKSKEVEKDKQKYLSYIDSWVSVYLKNKRVYTRDEISIKFIFDELGFSDEDMKKENEEKLKKDLFNLKEENIRKAIKEVKRNINNCFVFSDYLYAIATGDKIRQFDEVCMDFLKEIFR